MELKHVNDQATMCAFALLIVPYGIETRERSVGYVARRLLIVPYGIETQEPATGRRRPHTFNRTLWN